MAATTLKEKNIKIAKVDCVDQAELCQAHGVQGYIPVRGFARVWVLDVTNHLPRSTLKIFRQGAATEYNGPRKADGIVKYMTKCDISCRVVVQY